MNAWAPRAAPWVAAGGLAQVLLIAKRADSLRGWVPSALLCAALLAAPLLARRVLIDKTRAMLLITGAVGGAGMLVGALLDEANALPAGYCGAQPGAPWFNWMSGLMFITCVPACWFLCPRCGNQRAELLALAVSSVAMWLGMLAGGRLLGEVGVFYLGWAGMHLSMLAGMLLGVMLAEWARLWFARDVLPAQ